MKNNNYSYEQVYEILDNKFKKLAQIQDSAERAHEYAKYIGYLESIIAMTASGQLNANNIADRLKQIL